ncbi:MAG: cysteine desulfurase [Clostridia bacterium]|nr:cysteine desulfurase [Clostridia bacterium]
MSNVIYLDNASTTKLNANVLEKMSPYLTEVYGNANSTHFLGRQAVKGLDDARDTVAKLINADANEIYFTSGGTEGDNWALRGFSAVRGNKNKIVVSSIEHSAMLETLKDLELLGVKVVKIKPNKNGVVSVEDFAREIDNDTFLVALMLANNETGVIQPVKEVFEIAKKFGAYTFTDAVQYIPYFNVNVKELNADMISCSAHKFEGPKGVGFTYIKNGVKIGSIITGGHQERARRAGTSNVAGVIGLATALKLSRETLETDYNYVLSLRNAFIEKTLKNIDIASVNGTLDNRLPGNANILFKGISGEALLFNLDLNGVCASLGAACSAGSIDPSKTLIEMGLSEKDAKSSIRFTFSRHNTFEEVDKVVNLLVSLVEKLK